MRVADLTPPQRRLLRLARQSDPRPTTITPGEAETAEALVDEGLVEYEGTFGGKYTGVKITDYGRRALR